MLVHRLLIVIERNSVFGEVIVIHRCFNVQRIPRNRFAVSIIQLVLWESVRAEVVLVNETGRLDAVVVFAAL
jgi:hypothetical protein